MIVVAIIGLFCAHIALGPGGSGLIPVEFVITLLAPLWLTTILMFQAPATAWRLLKGLAITALLVTVPSWLGAANDRFPYQFESIFLLIGSYWLVLSCGLGYLASKVRHRTAKAGNAE